MGIMMLLLFNENDVNTNTMLSMLTTMQRLVEDDIYVSQGRIPIPTEAMLVISRSMPGA